MKYGQQIQGAMDRLDGSLAQLRDLIKRGENQAAINFMEQGDLKDKYEELQNLITISQVGQLGAGGTSQTGTL
jgi:hypothetical protein